jgi:hypothetical protein
MLPVHEQPQALLEGHVQIGRGLELLPQTIK